MKTGSCEKCQQREATVHLTFIESSGEVRGQQFCESCYSSVKEAGAGSQVDTTKPGAAPQPVSAKEMSFAKEPKVHGGKSVKQNISEGLWTKCPRCAQM